MAKTIGGVRGGFTAASLRGGVYADASVKAALSTTFEAREIVARNTYTEMLTARKTKGRSAAVRKYTREIATLSKEIEERFGTTDARAILTHSGLYKSEDAASTARLLESFTSPRPGAGTQYNDARDWWGRICRLDALKKGLAGIDKQRIQFTSYTYDQYTNQGL